MPDNDAIQYVIAGIALVISLLSLTSSIYFQKRSLRLGTKDADLRGERDLEDKLLRLAEDLLGQCTILHKEMVKLDKVRQISNRIITDEEIAPIRAAAFGLHATQDFLQELWSSPTANATEMANWILVLWKSYDFAKDSLQEIGVLHLIKHHPIRTYVVKASLDRLVDAHQIDLLDLGDPSVMAALSAYRRPDPGQ